jgi:hypothetical protein
LVVEVPVSRPDSDSLCLVAAAPSVTPWSLRSDHEELVAGGVDAVFATVACGS